MLARDLLQIHDLRAVLELVGPALRDVASPDDSLLLVTLGEEEFLTGFSARGSLQPADPKSILYKHARRALSDDAPLVLGKLSIEREIGPGGRLSQEKARLVVIPFPPVSPTGVLAALWFGDPDPELLAAQVSILRHLCELAGAALGNMDFQLALEEQVSACEAVVRATAHEHAKELQRRDTIEQEMNRIAVTDVMTGMLNRRGFFLHAERAFKVACRQRTACAVIFADIDGLKTVNDTLGHDIGDNLIRDGAQILRKSFRESDVVARLGGDEFAAFVFDSEHPETILSRIRENTALFHRQSSTPYKVAFSIGIVPCDLSSELTLADYLALADKKMYEHKRESH